MAYLYPLLLYTGLCGGLILLGMASIPRLRFLQKPATALWLTVMTLLWLMLPHHGRWLLSVWSPGAVLGGHILLDVTPDVWWLGLALVLTFTGAAWLEVAERRESSPLTGPLVLVILVLCWLAISSGSLLTILALWAVFDLVWGIAGLLAGTAGDRVVFGMATHGVASLILWVVSLFLLRDGVSELWWLMRPSAPMLALLVVAAGMRAGFYPFQIVVPQQLGSSRLLGLVHLAGPVTGIALLYRLMTLPGLPSLPEWVTLWGALSLLWAGLMAWNGHRQRSVLDAGHAVLAGATTGAIVLSSPAILLHIAGLWFAGSALLAFARGRDGRAIAWTWPVWGAVLYFLGAPPSPLGALYWTVLDVLPPLPRLASFFGLISANAVLIQHIAKRADGAATPPRTWQRVSLIAGLCVVGSVLVLVTATTSPVVFAGTEEPAFSWAGFGLWAITILAAAGLAFWEQPVRAQAQFAQPLMEFLDLQWLYRSMWRGAEHLLSFLRVSADVIEGSGALLWSLLIMLLIFQVVVGL